MKSLFNIAVLLCVFAGGGTSVRAQMAVPPPMPAYQLLSSQQLDQLLGPIALYPDPLIAQILPASTLPTQIVLADRYVSGGGNPGEIDRQPWDPSVQALARYPNVLKWMDDNLNWTAELGQAFINQQQDVMDSIQRLRQSAYNMGNLQSMPQQQVVNDGGYIEIVPADPEVIYVPVYQPAQVYYQSGYGSPFITFGIGFAIGAWLNCDFDWGHHNIIVWGHDHPRPPNWWHEPPRQRNPGPVTVWRPDNHRGAGAVNHGDRGWSAPNNRPVVGPDRPISNSTPPGRTPPPAGRQEPPSTRPSPPVARPAPAPVQHPQPVTRPAPAPVQHIQPVTRPPSGGAFIGIQSSHDTKTYSNRGQQSMQTIPRSEPAPRPAPAQASGGGGGGGRSSNPQPKH